MNIHIEHLTHTYAGRNLEARTVLDIDQWSLAEGTQALLHGISGSGKTTLMNIVAGLLPPTSGQVRLADQEIYALPEAERDRFRARHIGYIFQIHLLVPTLNALENVEMPLVFARELSASQRRAQAMELLDQMGLAEYVRHRPVQLSAGQRLRVAVARALVNRPSLLLADEPTAALDSENALIVMDLVQRICREQDATLLVASHDPALNERFERVVDLQAGRLVDERVLA
jgi:putative ABC transport system ATP-binding protein